MTRVVLYCETSRSHYYLMKRNPRYIPQRTTGRRAIMHALETFDFLFDNGIMRAYRLPSNNRRFFLVSVDAHVSMETSQMCFTTLLRSRLALSFVQKCDCKHDPEINEILGAIASGLEPEGAYDNVSLEPQID